MTSICNPPDPQPTVAADGSPHPASIPRGFRPANDPPKVGRRVLAVLDDGQPEFVTFERQPGDNPAVLFSFGYQVRGQSVVVRCWRPIPSNWSE